MDVKQKLLKKYRRDICAAVTTWRLAKLMENELIKKERLVLRIT